jgi:hypothetical protein
LTIDPRDLRPPRRSRPPEPARRSLWARVPYTIRFGLPIAVLALIGRESWLAWSATRARIQLVDASGQRIEGPAVAEFFVYDEDPAGPSPTALLARRHLEPDGTLAVGRDLIGAAALVRLEVQGHGIAYGLVEPGPEVRQFELGEPSTVRGRVVDAAGAAVAGARVQALGGGQRGVLLGETLSDAEGGFVIEGVSDSVRSWSFRVFAPGFGLGQLDWLSQPDEAVRIELEASAPARGRLLVDPTAADREPPALGDVALRIFHLPGVVARTEPDGSFAIPHLPAPPRFAYLLIPDLPPAWTYRRTALQAGTEREVVLMPARTLRGRVVNGHDGRGVAAAIVHHDHGPHGVESAVCDAGGGFELGRVPNGSVVVHAHVTVQRRSLPAEVREEKGRHESVMIQGSETLLIRPDAEPGELLIRLW